MPTTKKKNKRKRLRIRAKRLRRLKQDRAKW